MSTVRRWLRVDVWWSWWSLAAVGFAGLIILTVLLFPMLLRPDLSASERVRIERGGTDKLVAAENDRSNAQNNIRTTLLQGIAGVALVTGAYFAFRGLQERQLELAREGQITTRYAEAVKQLGDEGLLAVRIGGIYSLERIARDSDRDAPTVVALLSAFVRRSPREDGSRLLSDRAPDAQIALSVLIGFHGVAPANLRNADLRGADLRDAVLTDADLRDANLTDADLRGAKLPNAKLTGATVTNANMGLAVLTDADLTDATARDAKLTGAKLTGADLTGADLTGADLTGADLTGATMRYTVLIDGDLTGADLTGADLTGATMRYTVLIDGDLSGAD
jgi:uncharacterized protein YjbI with pentapeptide repeats